MRVWNIYDDNRWNWWKGERENRTRTPSRISSTQVKRTHKPVRYSNRKKQHTPKTSNNNNNHKKSLLSKVERIKQLWLTHSISLRVMVKRCTRSCATLKTHRVLVSRLFGHNVYRSHFSITRIFQHKHAYTDRTALSCWARIVKISSHSAWDTCFFYLNKSSSEPFYLKVSTENLSSRWSEWKLRIETKEYILRHSKVFCLNGIFGGSLVQLRNWI